MGDDIYKFKIVPNLEVFYNEDSSFGVFSVVVDGDIPEFTEIYDPFEEKDIKQCTVTGKMQQLFIGSEYEIEAKLEYNQRYKSYNYIPKSIRAIKPQSFKTQKKFLQAIATQRQADSLLAAYPNIVEDVINGKIKDIDYTKTKYIKDATWNNIKEKIIKNYVISDVLLLLQPIGVTYKMIKKLLNNYSPEELKLTLHKNPYVLTNIHGLGFKTIDNLAMKLTPDLRHSVERTYAFIKFYLNEIGDSQGHTWIKLEDLESAVRDNINECMDYFQDVIKQEKNNPVLLYIEDDKVGLKRYRNIEKSIFEILIHLDSLYDYKKWKINIEQGIDEANKEQGFNLIEEQVEMVKKATKGNISLLCGKAGTGKSTLLKALFKIYKRYSIGACALSAKASQRITEATGHKASTIHKLLGAKGFTEFTYNVNNPLPYEVIVIDEASMINAKIFYDLLLAVREGSKVIICGDNRQLPPIGFGNIFSDLLLKKDIFNICELTKVMRQAEDSGILSDANKIRDGINPIKQPELKLITGKLQDMCYMFRDDSDLLNQIAIKTYLSSVEQDGLDNVCLIVPRKYNCLNSTREINLAIQDKLIKKSETFIQYGKMIFKKGSKVIQRQNNYEKNVFNGEIGYLKDIWTEKDGSEKKKKYFSISYNNKVIQYTNEEISQIDLAYALTTHLAQGSGYKTAICIIDNSHYILLDSCMLYTMLTRSKERCLLLAQPSSYKRCIDNNKSIDRQTWLKDFEKDSVWV